LRANKRVATIARAAAVCVLRPDSGSLVSRRWHGRLALVSVERFARAGRPCHYPGSAGRRGFARSRRL